MTDQERLQFIEEIAVYVQKYAPVYGILVHSPIIAQACLESAYGTSKKAQYYNYFGLKYRGDRVTCASGYFTDTSAEQNADGSYTNITTEWYQFDDMDSGVEGYFQFTNIANYDNLKGVTDPRTYLENIKADGYATSLDYVDNVMAVIEKWNLTQYDNPIEQRGIKIAIDAGHGSDTAGKRHPDGYREHWSDTYMAFYLNQILVKNGFETFKTSWNDDNPTDDEDVALATRQSQILAFGADISVSIHANAYGDGTSYNSANGVSTHYHSNSARVGDSVALATAIQNQLILNTVQTNRGIVAQELAMCNCVAMGTKASVLVESAFMTNATESALLQSDEFCIEVAREIAQGIFNYFEITDADANVAVVLADRSYTDSDDIDIAETSVTFDNPVVEYYGNINCPVPIVTYGTITLILNTDYTVEYSNNINAGVGIATLTGIGNYSGTKIGEFIIEPRDISSGSWIYTEDENGCINLDELQVTCIGFTLEKGIDYTMEVSYSDYDGYKLAICTVTGIGNYDGTLTGGFFVEKYEEEPDPILIDINTLHFSISETEFTYSGSSLKPIVTNSDGLIENTDYKVSYNNGDFINAGQYKVIVTGIGSYTGTITYTVNIYPKSIIDIDFILSSKEFTYSGLAQKPSISNSSGLVENTDYTVSYSGTYINTGEYIVTINGMGNYTESKEYTFIIIPRNINTIEFNYSDNIEYTGSELDSNVECNLVIGRDYISEYSGDRINIGSIDTIITGINNYTGSVILKTDIIPKNISEEYFTVEPTTFIYNGDKKEVSILSSLVQGVDYTVTYSEDMINVGNKEVIITGINNYIGIISIELIIEPCDINNLYFSVSSISGEYCGLPLYPFINNSNGLVENTDYTIKYQGNFIDVGNHKVIVNGIGNYTGIITYDMNIYENDITDSIVEVETNEEGLYLIDTLSVHDEYRYLEEDVDYTINIEDYYNLETLFKEALVTITGINNYSGTINKVYNIEVLEPEITYIDINSCDIDIDTSKTIYYSGEENTLDISISYEGIELIENTDYFVDYENNINAGTAKVTITGLGDYINSKTETFTIHRQNISNRSIEIEQDTYEYSGDFITPEFELEGLVENTDYTVTYSDNKMPGTAKIIVKGINNYIGTIVKTFTIFYISIKNCIAEFGTPSENSEYRVDGEFKLYATKDDYFEGIALVYNIDYIILEESRTDFEEYTLVYIKAKGINIYGDTEEYKFKVELVENDPDTPPIIDDGDTGTYNFGCLDIQGSETAVGDYDFGCLDCGIDPNTVVIDGKDYDFNTFCIGEGDYFFNAGDIYDLKNTKVYSGYYSNEESFSYTGRVYIYNSTIVDGRIRVARIEDAVNSPARVFGWTNATDLIRLDILPVGTKVLVTGKIYEFNNGTGSYIEKNTDVMYIKEYIDSENIAYPYLLSNQKYSGGVGYATRDLLEVVDENS